MLTLFRDQPRPFYMIFMLEIWERFGYYTVQGILVLFFVRHLGFSDDKAYHTFGAFSALVYGLIAVGGYLGDQVLGTKRTIILGLSVLALGYLSLAFASDKHVFLALGLICVGNGLFKANPASLLSKCYGKDDPQLYSGFTLYYMAINIGSIFSLFIGPSVSHYYGYSYAYFISALGILMGLLNYFFQRRFIKHLNNPADQQPVSLVLWSIILLGIGFSAFAASILLQHVLLTKQLLIIIIIVLLGIYGYYMYGEQRASRLRMLLALILMVEAVIFFTLYQQMPTSINLFAVHNVFPSLFGIPLDPQSLQVLNPIWIIMMSPLMALFYDYLEQKNYHFPIPYKFATGMFFCGCSFIILYFTRFSANDFGMVSSSWLILSYLFQSIGELLVSALGVAMIAELVPKRIVGFVMGFWFVTSAIAGFTGASVAAFTALPKQIASGSQSLMVYTQVFAYIGSITLLIAIVLWLISPRLCRLMLR